MNADNRGIYIAQIDSYAGESLPTNVVVHEIVWLAADGSTGFDAEPQAEEFLARLFREAWRIDLASRSLILPESDDKKSDPIWFCRGNTYKGRYYRAPLALHPRPDTLLKLSSLASRAPSSGRLWKAFGVSTVETIKLLSEYVEGAGYFMIANPLNFSFVAVSANQTSVIEDMEKRAIESSTELHRLARNSLLPAW